MNHKIKVDADWFGTGEFLTAIFNTLLNPIMIHKQKVEMQFYRHAVTNVMK